MSLQRLTNRKRILAEVSNNKVQYPRLAVNNNPLYATSTCQANFSVLRYSTRICCSEIPDNCYPLPILTGGSPGTPPYFYVNGGLPGSTSVCLLNGGKLVTTCYSLSTMTGGIPSSIPSYIVNGGNPSTNTVCFITGGNV